MVEPDEVIFATPGQSRPTQGARFYDYPASSDLSVSSHRSAIWFRIDHGSCGYSCCGGKSESISPAQARVLARWLVDAADSVENKRGSPDGC